MDNIKRLLRIEDKPKGYGGGRIPQHDQRNLGYLAAGSIVAADAPFVTRLWPLPVVLNQGWEGACVGFAFAAELAASPVPIAGITDKFAREKVYWEAQKIDPWPGGAYPGASPIMQGTSILAGAQVLQRDGYMPEYRWAYSVDDMRRVIGNYGPMVLGINWFHGMDTLDANGFVHPTGAIRIGHAIAVPGVNEQGRYFTLHNSWGTAWGQNGRCKISFADMATLLAMPYAEACVPVRRADPTVPKGRGKIAGPGCNIRTSAAFANNVFAQSRADGYTYRMSDGAKLWPNYSLFYFYGWDSTGQWARVRTGTGLYLFIHKTVFTVVVPA